MITKSSPDFDKKLMTHSEGLVSETPISLTVGGAYQFDWEIRSGSRMVESLDKRDLPRTLAEMQGTQAEDAREDDWLARGNQ